jgi:hypothetical protein
VWPTLDDGASASPSSDGSEEDSDDEDLSDEEEEMAEIDRIIIYGEGFPGAASGMDVDAAEALSEGEDLSAHKPPPAPFPMEDLLLQGRPDDEEVEMACEEKSDGEKGGMPCGEGSKGKEPMHQMTDGGGAEGVEQEPQQEVQQQQQQQKDAAEETVNGVPLVSPQTDALMGMLSCVSFNTNIMSCYDDLT